MSKHPRTLSEIVDLVADKTGANKDPTKPYLGLEHLRTGTAKPIGFSSASTSVSTNNVFKKGDTLFGKLRPQLRKCVSVDFDGYCSTDILVLRAVVGVDSIYASKTMQSEAVFAEAIRTEEGTKMPRCSWESLKELQVHSHTFNEQRKIARILTTLDNLIEKTEALIAKYQSIKQGMMHDLFTRGVDESGRLRPTHEQAPDLYKQSELGWIPKEWDEGWLGDEIGPITSGWSPLCDAVPATRDQWAIQKTTVCVWSGYDETENKRLPDHFQPKPHLEVQKDDILVTRKGPFDRVGVVVHVHETRPKLMFPDTVFRLRLNNDSDVLPAFLPLALGSEAVQADWYGRKIGLADAQVNINHGILKTTYFPKPKPDEQKVIVGRLLKTQTQIRTEERQLKKLSSIKSGLMQDLLTGKVRVKVDEAEEACAHA